MDGHPVIFYFDYSSPFAYLAAHKINALARLYGREVDWRRPCWVLFLSLTAINH